MHRRALLWFLALIILLDLSALSCERKNPNADRMKDLFLSPADYLVGVNPTTVTAADINHDRHLDLVVAVRADKIQIYLGQGNGKFVKKTVFDPGDTPTSVKVWDFNHDGQLDLAVANNGAIGNNLSIFFGKGDGTFVL